MKVLIQVIQVTSRGLCNVYCVLPTCPIKYDLSELNVEVLLSYDICGLRGIPNIASARRLHELAD